MARNRILVVEDDENINQVIVKNLTSAGYAVISYLDGLEAANAVNHDADYNLALMNTSLSCAEKNVIARKTSASSFSTHFLLYEMYGGAKGSRWQFMIAGASITWIALAVVQTVNIHFCSAAGAEHQPNKECISPKPSG